MRAFILAGAAALLASGPALAQVDHSAHGAPAPSAKVTAAPPSTHPAQAAEAHAPEAHKAPEPAAPAMDHSTMDHGVMDHGAMNHGAMTPSAAEGAANQGGSEEIEPAGDAPAPAPPTDHAADRYFDRAAMDRARAIIRAEHGGGIYHKVMVSLAEYRFGDGDEGYRWEGEAWIGGDINRAVVKTEGEGEAGGHLEAAEVQLLYSRAIGPYFDAQAGVRQDLHDGPRRTHLALGVEGVAPYWFETEATAFLSAEGELTARLEASTDFRLTQRWIVQPQAEANLAARDVPELRTGSGLTSLELGLRLRYEVTRQFAPYVGVTYERSFGGSARYARLDGEPTTATGLVIGIRSYF